MRLIGDIRFAMNQLPNTVAAAKAAVAAGFDEIALSAVFAPPFDTHREQLFCCPLMEEYDRLSIDDYALWVRTFIIDRNYQRPVMLAELMGEAGASRYWVFVRCLPEQRKSAVEFLRSKSLAPTVSVFEKGDAPVKEGCADTTGRAEYAYCPSTTASVMSLMRGVKNRTLTYGRNSLGEYRLVPAP
jgi:hypothetical protein